MDLEQAADNAIEFLEGRGHVTHLISGKSEGNIYKVKVDVGLINREIKEVEVDAKTGKVLQCQDYKEI